MIARALHLSVLAAALAGGGCAARPAEIAYPRALGLSRREACPPATRVAGGEWQTRRLLPPGTAAPDRIRRMCVYDWRGPRPPEMAALPREGIEIEIDAAVLPHAEDPGRGADFAALRAHTRASLGALERLPEALSARPAAVIGFVDITPEAFGEIPEQASSHARAVASLARALACPDPAGPCLATPAFTRGARGGSSARSALAEGILAMLALRAARAPDRPLVVNLSVGWEPAAECARGDADSSAPDPRLAVVACPAGHSPRLSLGAEAVHHALVRAACEGALIVAASGNDRGAPRPAPGPTLPAAWESLPRPSAEECASLGITAAPPGRADIAHPLLHAAGGITDAGAPLSISRPRSQPRLVAAAAQSVLYRDADTGPRPRPLTGTSMAAAAASGTAAAVWSAAPSLSADEVMAILHATGADLGVPAHTACGEGPCPSQRRLSFCRALAAVAEVACPDFEFPERAPRGDAR